MSVCARSEARRGADRAEIALQVGGDAVLLCGKAFLFCGDAFLALFAFLTLFARLALFGFLQLCGRLDLLRLLDRCGWLDLFGCRAAHNNYGQ
jgi:hypothetical protein